MDGAQAEGFRITHYSIQANHFHLLVESDDRTLLWKGMASFLGCVSKGVNKFWGRSGQVFPERYHHVVLKACRQVRNALRYVFTNATHHGRRIARFRPLSTAGSGSVRAFALRRQVPQ